MPYRDLQSFLETLEQGGELLRLPRTIDPSLEVSAVLREAEESQGPALLCEKVKGTAVPVVGNLFASADRLRLALNVQNDLRAEVVSRLGRHIGPSILPDGPVQQVIRTEGIDLNRLLPRITYHCGDKGPYITTGIILFRNPESQRIMMGIHRMQIQKPSLLSAQIVTPLLSRWVGTDSRESFPVAVVLGVEPGFFLGSVLQDAPETDRLESIGGLRGEAVEVVRAISQELPVPAHAEMVLEGRILPGRRVAEGPMGESSGVYTTNRSHLIQIDTVTHRRGYLAHALVPWSRDEEAVIRTAYAIPMELRLRTLEPAVRALHLVPGTCGTHAVVSIHKSRPAQGRDLITLCLDLFSKIKHLVVVDDDVDPANHRMVAWAMATRFQADRDLVAPPPARGFAIDPSAHRANREILTARLGMDATIPLEARNRFQRIDVGDTARQKAQRILVMARKA